MRSLQTELPLARERNSGSAVRLPVRTTRLMLVAAIGVAPFLPSLRPRSLGGRVYVRARSDPRKARKLGGFCDRVVADTGGPARNEHRPPQLRAQALALDLGRLLRL